MTPQERQLINELFDRLATLEGERRDPDAERAIAEGFHRAPNAAYALVQTVLVQDEALKRANTRIEELQAAHAAAPAPSGFLDNMRNAVMGRDAPPRGSVPSVRSTGMGTSGVWNTNRDSGWGARADSAPPMTAAPPAYGGGGGSFLGTAAAGAAGVIGGAMLLNGIRSMFGPSHGGIGSAAFDPGAGGGQSPWGGNPSGSDLARDAGLDDISGNRSASSNEGGQHAGLFGSDDSNADDSNADDSDLGDSGDDGGGFDGGDTDSA
jgi:uncharacterized protein